MLKNIFVILITLVIALALIIMVAVPLINAPSTSGVLIGVVLLLVIIFVVLTVIHQCGIKPFKEI